MPKTSVTLAAPTAMTYYSREGGDAAEPKRIGFIVADETSSFDLLGSLEAFSMARVTGAHAAGGACYENLIIGVDAHSFLASSGATIKVDHTIRNAPALDTIIIPGGIWLQNSQAAQKVASWLIDRAKATRRIAAISSGIYPLASAGLLNGRCATTHWRLAADVARRFQAVSVGTAASFVKTDNFYTSGGGIAGMEMSLALIEEDFGRKTAVTVARELSIDLRPAGAGREIAQPQHQPGPAERLAELPAWITSRLHRDLTVEVLAERAGLSPRHFYRLFRDTFKKTPAAFIEQLRMDEARRRLAAARENVDSVAASVGFKSPAVFRRAFGRQFGFPPSALLRSR